ncbi:10110_t:CDS:2 [Gigaspora margarita]|uniref:10110_t:CDS:1 n=1 Tax=Gigaspora margarita TaxID=4874 RepID=A0ABN7VRG0_GIGMA|nr:10110_t:CDS:2 [Gigaspora margarita]
MSSLSKKVAGITLLIDHFENHLDSQGNRKDLIYKKPVFAKYVDKQTNPFSNILSSINENELENKQYKENSKKQR